MSNVYYIFVLLKIDIKSKIMHYILYFLKYWFTNFIRNYFSQMLIEFFKIIYYTLLKAFHKLNIYLNIYG